MKTLLPISVTAGADATGRCADLIGRLAMSKGWRSVIAYGRRRPVTTSETIRIGNLADTAIHGVVSRMADAHGRVGRRATQHLIRQIEAINPDIIHLHNIHGYYLHYPTLFRWLRECGRPVVWTLHDTWPLTGHCAFPDAADCSRWRRGCGKCPLMRDYPKSWFVDASRANYADKMTAFSGVPNMVLVPVSQWLSDMVGHTPLAAYPRQVIHNGIDTSVFTPSLIAPEQPMVIAVAKKWEPRKGLDHFYALRRYLPDEWNMFAVGLSRHQLRHLPEGISAMTGCTPDMLASLLRISSVSVVPSLSDNYPTTIIESLAAGTPVASYDVGGCSEALSADTGRLAPVGDPAALAAAVIEASTLSRAACAATVATNNYTTAFTPYLHLYTRLLTPSVQSVGLY